MSGNSHIVTDFKFENNIYIHSSFVATEFESEYLTVRRKEHRIFTDEEVLLLPTIRKTHPLKNEWFIRKKSSEKLKRYLQSKKGKKNILEIGCGNGWICKMMSSIPESEIIGIDVNKYELLQAARVCRNIANVRFILGNIEAIGFDTKFDAIILASSLQYFPNPSRLILQLQNLLSTDGEIHIVDTPIYDSGKIQEAKSRSDAYFSRHDAKMSHYYFHHSWQSFKPFDVLIKYNPKSFQGRIGRFFLKESPFPWLIIRKSDHG